MKKVCMPFLLVFAALLWTGCTSLVEKSDNAALASLTVSHGTLSPEFSSAVYDYALPVANSVHAVTVTGVAEDSGASVGGQSGQSVDLNVGDTAIEVVVTAADGKTRKTYTVLVTRAAPDLTNADLDGLSVSQGALEPDFDPAIQAYELSLPYAVTEVTVTGVAEDDGATVGGQSGQSVSLNVGDTAIAVVVTAADGTTEKTYTVTVTRSPAGTNANLASLTVSRGTLSPAFSSSHTAYAVSVANSVTSITVTGVAEDPNASVGGQSGQSVSLPVGSTDVTVTVTAEDGVTEKPYTVTVTRADASVTPFGGMIIDHSNYDPASLSDAEIAAAAALDVYLEHASVGYYMTTTESFEALETLNARYSCGQVHWEDNSESDWYDFPEPAWYDTNNGLGDLYRGNPPAADKVSGFVDSMNYNSGALAGKLDVAMFKYCYIDTPASAQDLFDATRSAMEGLQAAYPGVTFVWWTMPIDSPEGNSRRQAFNDLVRSYCEDNGQWLFDIAAIESHDDSGAIHVDSDGYEIVYSAYTDDGGHPNAAGCLKLVKAYWRLIAEIAKSK